MSLEVSYRYLVAPIVTSGEVDVPVSSPVSLEVR